LTSVGGRDYRFFMMGYIDRGNFTKAEFLSLTFFLASFLLAAGFLSGASGPPAFNIRTIPPDLAKEVDKNPAALSALGKDHWTKMLDVSHAIANEGLTAVAERTYLPLPVQRGVFRAVQNSKNIPEDAKLVLQDLVIQYYFLTYYFPDRDPRRDEFEEESRKFLQELGIEYLWIEPAAQNYYQHTFLRELVLRHPQSRWGRFYLPIYEETGFEEIPRESEGEAVQPAPKKRPPRTAARFRGEINEGQTLEKYFGPGFHFFLVARPLGWEIVVRYLDEDENIARLTPPFHGVPNPRDIEGWHFRNSDNSGANEPGEKNVNAPGEEREFIFSPDVGRAIQGAGAWRSVTGEDIEKVRAFGQGKLIILEYKLGNLKTGEQAKFEWMRFDVELTWPSRYVTNKDIPLKSHIH
jgi:hypothetical protein